MVNYLVNKKGEIFQLWKVENTNVWNYQLFSRCPKIVTVAQGDLMSSFNDLGIWFIPLKTVKSFPFSHYLEAVNGVLKENVW